MVLGLCAVGRADSGVVTVEPGELTKRTDLIGREVSVDDRVRFFQSHPGRGFDEIELRGTPVGFRLPVKLRYDHPPDSQSVRVQGILRREGDRLWCEVSRVDLLGDDLERLDQAVAGLPARDSESRVEWARWAERRGKAYRDDRLLKRARGLETEAIRLEADRAAATAEHWLALARRARTRLLDPWEGDALAHRGLRAQLKAAHTVEELTALRARIEEFLPKSAERPEEPADTSPWDAPYANDPAGAYRMASAAVRVVFDHRLWADTVQALLERQLAADPAQGMALAGQAATLLPDRPALATQFLEKGLNAATHDLTKLRRTELDALAKVYRDQLHQPDRAEALYRDWLAQQRKTLLGPTDAEGRVALADRYVEILNDRATAVELLREAWKIAPDSGEVADAFRRFNFRKNADGEWVETNPPRTGVVAQDAVAATPRPVGRDRQWLGLTPEEVERRIGAKPQRIVRAASRGQLVIQWIYVDGKEIRFVNFLQSPGDRKPRCMAFHSLTDPSQVLP